MKLKIKSEILNYHLDRVNKNTIDYVIVEKGLNINIMEDSIVNLIAPSFYLDLKEQMVLLHTFERFHSIVNVSILSSPIEIQILSHDKSLLEDIIFEINATLEWKILELKNNYFFFDGTMNEQYVQIDDKEYSSYFFIEEEGTAVDCIVVEDYDQASYIISIDSGFRKNIKYYNSNDLNLLLKKEGFFIFLMKNQKPIGYSLCSLQKNDAYTSHYTSILPLHRGKKLFIFNH